MRDAAQAACEHCSRHGRHAFDARHQPRGCPMTIRAVAEDYWSGAIDPRRQSPFAPLMQAEEMAPGVLFVSSFANVTALATEGGLVLVDTGSAMSAEVVHGCVRRFSEAPVH